jgi:hypothetical protein
MQLFGNLKDDGLKLQGDRLGGQTLFDADYYEATVNMAYVHTSSSGARAIVLTLDIGGRNFTETFYVTNKDGKNSYPDKKNPSIQHEMIGYAAMKEFSLLTTGVEFQLQNFEEKVVKIYDFEQRKDVPTNVPVMIDVLGKKIGVGLIRRKVDKKTRGQDNVYRATGETREENAVDKFFHAESGRIVSEFMNGIETPEFREKWLKVHKGKIQDRVKGAEGNQGMPGGAGGASRPAAGNPFSGAPAQSPAEAASKRNPFAFNN